MPEFIFAYHGGRKPESEEEGAEMMAQWNKWIEDNKDALVNPGNPVGMSKTVSKDGVADDGGSNPLMGFSIVQAGDIDGAIAVAKSCPFVEMGEIEVAELMEM